MSPDRIYAVGDIHGYLDKLKAVHEAIEADLAANPVMSHLVVHIGDYTDRGPESRGVIDYLIDGAVEAKPWLNLLGNHDRMFLKFMSEPGGVRSAFAHGSLLAAPPSWRAGNPAQLRARPARSGQQGRWRCAVWRGAGSCSRHHIQFLKGLSDSYHAGPWFFAHAGVAPGVNLRMQDEDDLIWIRGPFLKSSRDHGAVIVHGHTPTETEEVEDHGNGSRLTQAPGMAGRSPVSWWKALRRVCWAARFCTAIDPQMIDPR